MAGQGVLHACLQAADVTDVLAVVRKPTGIKHAKLREVVHAEMLNLAAIEDQLAGFDACFFCIGLTTTRVAEAAYTRVTYDITVAVAETLARINPESLFVYLSGSRTDTTEQSRMMQERVRGRTENALAKVGLRRLVILRPEMIVPVEGDRPKTPALRLFYGMMKPLLMALRMIAPHHIATTRQIGQAMLAVARKPPARPALDGAAIRALTR